MLDEEQRRTVVEMFSSGKSISEISRQVGVSRPSVYRVIASDVEKDAEILSLKKELRKTELRKKIEEVKEPIKTKSELDTLGKVVYELVKYIVTLWTSSTEWNPELNPPDCFYCGGELEYYEKESEQGYKCRGCKRDFPSP